VTTWSDEELRRIGEADELQISSRRADDTLRPYVTIWVVTLNPVDNGWANPALQPENRRR
jgi:hypothetical protein